jgi:putative transposase
LTSDDRTYPSRRSIRLPTYDYTSGGAYFVTICTQNGECLFGRIRDAGLSLNAAGQMVDAEWQRLPERFPTARLDTHVVMPNHFHGIVWIVENDVDDGDAIRRPALGDIIGAFKSLTTQQYIRGVRDRGWRPFERRVWQRNYWEHVVRDEDSLNDIRQYIEANPERWVDDQLHPDAPQNPFSRSWSKRR